MQRCATTYYVSCLRPWAHTHAANSGTMAGGTGRRTALSHPAAEPIMSAQRVVISLEAACCSVLRGVT